MRFDLIDLRLFVHVAETSSLTRGAERSHLSLPAASKRIKHLEESLGTRMLYRTIHGVSLTPAGQTFLQHARQVRQQLEVLRADMEPYALGSKGRIRMYANATAITESLAAVLPDFVASHPGINIDLQERLNPDIVRAVTEGTADVGVVAGDAAADGLQSVPCSGERLVLVVPRGHPLAGCASLPFVRTLAYPHIGLPPASAIHGVLCDAARNAGQPLSMRMQLGNCDAVCRMVEAGAGIAVLPHTAARRHARTMAICTVALEDDWAFRRLYVVVRDMQALPHYARDLIDLLAAGALVEEPAG